MKSIFKGVVEDLREVYEYRSVLRSLVLKNLFGKYRNSFLGFAWNFITPLLLMLMYYLDFTEIRENTSIDNAWVFISTAVFLFHYLTHCIVAGSTAFIGNASTLKKMYIPKEILVLSASISSMIVCLIGYSVVMVLLIVTTYPINIVSILCFPVILILSFFFGTGCIFALSSLATYVRDVQYVLGSLTLAFFVLTPMRYMASDATGLVGILIWYNPLTYYIEVVHDIFYWGVLPNSFNMLVCTILSVVVFVMGYVIYRMLKHGIVKRL